MEHISIISISLFLTSPSCQTLTITTRALRLKEFRRGEYHLIIEHKTMQVFFIFHIDTDN